VLASSRENSRQGCPPHANANLLFFAAGFQKNLWLLRFLGEKYSVLEWRMK